MNRHVTQLRFQVGERLHSDWYDLMQLDALARLQISARLKAEDVCKLRWEPTIDGQRFNRSRLALGPRIKAASGSLEDLLRAIEQNEQTNDERRGERGVVPTNQAHRYALGPPGRRHSIPMSSVRRRKQAFAEIPRHLRLTHHLSERRGTPIALRRNEAQD